MDKYSRTIISPQVFLSKYLQFDWQKWNRVRDITSRLSDYNLLFLENYFWKEYNQTVPEIFSRAQIGDERSLVLALYVKNKNYSLNKKDDTGKTVLHWILQTCSNMLFNFFLKNGADPLSKDNFGQSVVTICCINGLTDKLRLIIDHISKSTLNEECTRKDSYGMTCLHYLTKNAYNGGEHRESLREIVIKSEVDINIKSGDDGYTPTHIAVLNQDLDTLQLCIILGAKLAITDNSGKDVFDYLLTNNDFVKDSNFVRMLRFIINVFPNNNI